MPKRTILLPAVELLDTLTKVGDLFVGIVDEGGAGQCEPIVRKWREQSRSRDIKAGLQALVGEIRSRGITSIAIPPLGSGLGGLYWPDVRALIEEAFHELDGVRVLVFEPAEDPNAVRCNNHTRDVPNMTAGRAPPVEQMRTSVKS
uniref:Macro domain-containing protein n=1 Tax=Chlorobium phaeovibrioides (strain DSM 265 / 1930) TaxID=290318 RepID=A4SDW3_CHLPM